MIDIKRVNSKVVAGLPHLAQQLCRYTPATVQARLLALGLNQFFSRELAQGTLDFMQGKTAAILMTDLDLHFALTVTAGRLQVQLPSLQQDTWQYDVQISASAADFLLLVNNRVDPDTLFFRRRLTISGDTELGLYIKNLLDSIEVAQRLPAPLLMLSAYLADQLQSASCCDGSSSLAAQSSNIA